jgi:selenide,water dikinase
MTKGGSQPGDVLLLTKPLGSGVVTTALKRQWASQEHVDVAVSSMKRLNKEAAAAALACQVRSMTDITGFGLLGHAHEMAHLSVVDFQIQAGSLQWLPGAIEYGRLGAFPGGMGNNRDYFQPWVRFQPGVSDLNRDMLWTPETSGGLLVAVSPGHVDEFLRLCPEAFQIGRVVAGEGHLDIHHG